MEVDYFSVYRDALNHLNTMKNGILKRGYNPDDQECFIWRGSYSESFLYYSVSSFIRGQQFPKMESKEDELRIMKKLYLRSDISSANKASQFEWILCHIANGDEIEQVKHRVKKLNSLLPHGDYEWRIPNSIEIKLFDFHEGVYWCTDNKSSESDRFSACGIAYNFSNNYFTNIRYHDSKHINGTSRFEGGGYNESPKLILLR